MSPIAPAGDAANAADGGAFPGLGAEEIRRAATRIAGVAVRTPLLTSPLLDKITRGRVFLKAETLQRTGSFKFRGAYNKISAIPAAQRAAGVVAYSSGNHAQAVAASAALLGMPAVIVMPKDAPATKRAQTAAFGAEIVLYDRDREDRETLAAGIATERAAVLVPPYDDSEIIAGQGTVGSEIISELGSMGIAPDIIAVGISGGGLAAGIALAVKGPVPSASIYVVEPEGFDDTARSLASGSRETNMRTSGTICDALMVATPGRLTFPINRNLLAGGVTVSDGEVATALAFAFQNLKLVVEPSGAVGLAALLAGKIDVAGKVAVAVLSGGNVDADLFARLTA